jgi:hypothetical protein
MEITLFQVSEDKTTLDLTLQNAEMADTLHLWTNKTYKTEGLQIDLSDKLNGAASQSITITLEDLGLSEFDGIYFIDVIDDVETKCAIAEELTRYKECIVDKVSSYVGCDSCLETIYPEVLNALHSLITLEIAIELALPQEILNIVFALDKFCNNDCKGCGKYKNI